ncbi:MAG: 4Fe-4S dicluster domain-containing protein [Oscillospiraceae bacterium]|nr:4Fe-4S dicluster domain-containing protein [Oscillospiraceae bacterium]
MDIPTCFACYNETFSEGYMIGWQHYMMQIGAITSKQNYASKCVQCRRCEKHCPQSIEISQRLKEVKRKLEPFWFKPGMSVARKVMRIK